MAKVTSKYQVTVPRTIAERYNIRPGDDIDWVAVNSDGQSFERNKVTSRACSALSKRFRSGLCSGYDLLSRARKQAV
jgi:AbrB family looped-hinge helix DNA binding protein